MLRTWLYSGAAVAGRGHESEGIPCQDAVVGRSGPEGGLLVLADGAGSAKLSHLGATAITSGLMGFLWADFEKLYECPESDARQAVLGAARDMLVRKAREAEARIADLACTLLFAVVSGDRYMLGHIGDGVIAGAIDGEWMVLSEPTRGEFANETVFVTSSRAAESFRIERGRLQGLDAFVVFSDGTATGFHDRRTGALAPGLAAIARWQRSNAPLAVNAALAANLRERLKPRTKDDCSIGILSRISAGPDELTESGRAFQAAFLSMRHPAGIRNRLAVARECLEAKGPLNARKIASSTGMSAGTVRGHLRALAPFGVAAARSRELKQKSIKSPASAHSVDNVRQVHSEDGKRELL